MTAWAGIVVNQHKLRLALVLAVAVAWPLRRLAARSNTQVHRSNPLPANRFDPPQKDAP